LRNRGTARNSSASHRASALLGHDPVKQPGRQQRETHVHDAQQHQVVEIQGEDPRNQERIELQRAEVEQTLVLREIGVDELRGERIGAFVRRRKPADQDESGIQHRSDEEGGAKEVKHRVSGCA
jgi:hypothetical protein